MILLVSLAAAAAYVLAALFTARAVFERQRAKRMDEFLGQRDVFGHARRYTLDQARREFDRFDKGDAFIVAALVGIFPPVAAAWWIGRWFEATATDSAQESRARMEELEAENARLAAELGIGGEP